MLKNIVRAMVMSGVIVVFAPATQTVQAAGGGQAFDFRQALIVGSWLGTIDNGEQILMSFNVDGVAFSSFQGEVKTTAPVLTAAHGAWTYVGGRQFPSPPGESSTTSRRASLRGVPRYARC